MNKYRVARSQLPRGQGYSIGNGGCSESVRLHTHPRQQWWGYVYRSRGSEISTIHHPKQIKTNSQKGNSRQYQCVRQSFLSGKVISSSGILAYLKSTKKIFRTYLAITGILIKPSNTSKRYTESNHAYPSSVSLHSPK